jgi:CRP-like cAMP-binding protein
MMSQDNPIQLLLQAIDNQGLWLEERELKRADFLVQADSLNNNIYYIVSGTIRVYVYTDSDEEQVVRFGYEGDIMTALDAFISDKPTAFYIQAIKKCRVKVISKAAFMQLISSEHKLMQIWCNVLQQLVYQQIERELDLLTESPTARYQRVLARSPRLFQQIPSRHIASYLRMRAETFSRIKKNLDFNQDLV